MFLKIFQNLDQRQVEMFVLYQASISTEDIRNEI